MIDLRTPFARCCLLVLIACVLVPANAQTRELLNYRVIHKPVTGDRGMVVSQNQVASEIGAQVLRDGGNAVDAAVATAFVLAVTLPRAGNLGGDGFMLVHLAEEGRTFAIDYRSAAPAAAVLDAYLDAEGKVDGATVGYKAAGVPGTVAGLALAHEKYGRLPWARLLEPAIALAADGVVLSADEAFALDWGKQRLSQSEAGAAVFLHPDGSALRAGERLVQADLAWSLRQIASRGAEAFYRGEIAKRLDAGMRKHGGLLRAEDLAAYRAMEREPLVGTYRGIEVATMPPVSGGGLGIVSMLNLLENFDMASYGSGSADALHRLAESMKLAWRDRARYAGDPGFVQMPLVGITSKAYARQRAALIAADRSAPLEDVPAGDPWPFESTETTHLAVVDADGNAVSNTYTIGSDFGSGVMIEGTGFLLGNLIGNFSIAAQTEGRAQGNPLTANQLEPGRRPVSSMAPTMLLRDGKPWLVTGSPGGNTIPGTIVQIIVGVVDFGQGVAEATSAPRVHQEMRGDGELHHELGISPDTLKLLRARGHLLQSGETIGSTQSILIDADGVHGAADPRRPGAAAIAE